MADPTPPPFDLDASILTRGATFGGRVLRRAVFEWDDGKLEAALPQPAARDLAAIPPGPKYTPMQRAVVQMIGEMKLGEKLTYDQMAARAGYSNSGPFREFVKDYVEQTGRLEPLGDAWEKVA